jgi:hypothetical protein
MCRLAEHELPEARAAVAGFACPYRELDLVVAYARRTYPGAEVFERD